MPRPDLFADPYHAPVRELVELADPRQPGWGMSIELSRGPLTDYAAGEIHAEMLRRYIDGDPELGMKPQPFMVNGKPQKTTPAFWEDVAYVCALQPEGWSLEFDRYSPEELAMLPFKHRAAWAQIGAAVARLVAAENPGPNVSTEDGAAS